MELSGQDAAVEDNADMDLLHAAPPSFEDPIEMLEACHDKVRHFATLVPRIAQHVSEKGVDQQARDAAQSVMRYFDLAAPLHHDDEEQDLFPALRALDDPALTARLNALESEHQHLAGLWATTRHWLAQVHSGQHPGQPPADVEQFARAYPEHANREEEWIYPHAERLAQDLLRDMGARMARRRQIN